MADLNPRRNAEQSVDEMLQVRGRQPGRAQPHVNFGGWQIRRLHRFQRLDILAEADIGDTGGIGGDKPDEKTSFLRLRMFRNGGSIVIVP